MVRISRWFLRPPRPAGRRARLLTEWLEDRAVPAVLADPSLVALARIDTGGDRTSPLAKVGFDLALLSREAAAGVPFIPSNSLLQVAQGYVAVEAFPAGDRAALDSALAGLGYTAGWLPFRSISAAAELPELASMRPAYRLTTSAGGTMTQGDTAQRSDDVRRLLTLDGTGVSVGVISDSFNVLGGATADVASGDLPASINVLSEGAGGADEGRAMLQVVHDVAPGAQLLFATAGTTQLQLATSIRALANAGADVIVDDVTFPAEPMFQDGPVAQAVTQVADAGVVYFSAAGNLGRQSYESAYRSSGLNLGSSGTGLIPTTANFLAHNFDTSGGVDYLQWVTLPAGKTTFSFQWADRYASAGGPGARIDMDMALFDENGVFLATIGGFDSNVGGDPTEVFEVDAGPTGGRYQIALGKFSVTSPDPVRLKYVAFSDGFVQNEYDTQSSTVFGHANAAGAAAVGAARYSDTPRFGTDPGVARSFTGRGGTPVFTFDADGNPTGSATRPEPRFVAPDGVNTTFFGPADDEPDGRPNFTGTSAAAPHAAGVAALMLQANRNLTPAQVIDTLAATAIDIGAPGVDVDTGAGLIQALPAVLAVGGHFDVTLDGGDGDDAFLVRRDTSGAYVEFLRNGTLVAAIPADKLGYVTVHGGAGSDTLTVDHVNGDPLTSAGLSFAGGENSDDNDRLVVAGYHADLVVVSHNGPETGTVQIGTSGLVSFAEVEPVELEGEAADLHVNLPTTPNPGVEVGDDGPAGRPGFSAVAGTTFEYTRFRNPTHALVVGLGAGGNAVALRAPDAAFAASVTVAGGSGMDAVTLFGGGGDDAVAYAPDAGDGGVLTLGATRFTLSGIESLAADGLGQPGADAVTVNAPRAGVAFGLAAGSGTVSVASAAGAALLALVYRNFEQAAVAATVVAVGGTGADDTVSVSADGTVELGSAGGAAHAVRVSADQLDLNGLGGADAFIVAADHVFAGGVSLDGGDTGGANSLRVVGSGGAVSFTPSLTGLVNESGHGVISYVRIGPVAVDAGAGHLTLRSVDPNGTADVRLTGPTSATAQLMSAGQVSLTTAALTVTAPTTSSGDGLCVSVAAPAPASADATVAGGAVRFAGLLPVFAGVGVDSLMVAGSAADDTFTVTPGPLPLVVDGGTETAGDRLVLVGSAPGRPAAGSGSLGTTPAVTYQSIELFTLGAVPAPAPDTATTPEGQAVTIPVLANDGGLGDGPFTLSILSSPAAGFARVVGDAIVYTPAPGATPAGGPVTFTYRVTDANGESADGTVTVTLTSVNDAPRAFPQSVTLAAGSSVALQLLGDDGDPDVVQTLVVSVITPPSHGTLTDLDPTTGRATYTPAPGYDGPDSFTFVVTDDATAGGPARTSAPATVYVQVTRQNRPPVAADDAITVMQGSLTSSPLGGVRANDADPDGDPLVVSLLRGTAHGRLTLDGRGSYTYAPDPGFSGTDSFVYAVTDPRGAAATATVTITVTPTPRHFLATGAGAGGGPHVKVFDADTGAEVYSFFAYDASFRGGVRVAVGDVNGDGVPDIVTTPGPGGGPHVKVFSGVDLAVLASFFAYDPSFRSGANVALGDLDADGVAEVVTGAAPGGGSHVRSFHITAGGPRQFAGPLGSFFAFGEEFAGGVNVALGDYDGVAGDEIIVGAATESPEVRVFGRDGTVLAAFLAFDVDHVGITVAAGDVDGDGRADIVVGPGDGGGPVVRTFRGGTGELMTSTAAFDEGLRGGISVATTASRTPDGRAAVIVAPTQQARSVLVLDPGADRLLDAIDAYAADFPGGVFVGAG